MGACQSAPTESTSSGPSSNKAQVVKGKTTTSTQVSEFGQLGDVTAPSSSTQKGKNNKTIREQVSGLSSQSGGGSGGGGLPLTRNDNQYHHNIDETEKTYNENSISLDDPARTSSDSDDDNGKRRNSHNDENNEPSIQVEFEVLPLKKDGPSKAKPLHKRNSSCSSYDSWGGGKSIDSIAALSELNYELKSCDDGLCTRVVRIETDFGKPIEDVYDGVHDGPVLGSGVSGIVRLVKHRKTGVSYAVKCLDIGLLNQESGYNSLREEIFCMCKLDHPNIVRLEEVYENHSEIYLIQELCLGGDLFDRLDEQPDYHYTEAQCARLIKQMLSSVRYLHSKNIIHRDLKLENFLFSSNKEDSELKMIDFGLSKHFDMNETHHEAVGTPYSVAPDVIKGCYNERCDIWSVGVITYLLLCGETPFGGADGECLLDVRSNILKGQVRFEPADIWDNVSDMGKNFIRRLLNPDPKRRPTAKEAQKDPWIRVYTKKDTKEGKSLSRNVVSALVEFKEYSDMRKLLYEVLSFTLLPEQIVELRAEFEKMDTNGDGEITLSAMKQVLMDNAELGTLGALTEEEIEDIFNALRVRKTEPTIRWHEFIAATLSRCSFDERNLRLAFDRLDYDRNGFITYDDMKEMMLAPGTGGGEEANLYQIWNAGINECKCPLERITYTDFLRLMKGQSRDGEGKGVRERRRSSASRVSMDSNPLDSVPEGSVTPDSSLRRKSLVSLNMAVDLPSLPPLSPVRTDKKSVDIGFPADISKPVWRKSRSRSLDGEPGTSQSSQISDGPVTPPPIPAPQSPTRKSSAIRTSLNELQHFINDDTKTPLVVNRALYRKHREMRQSILVASKLFDKKRQERKLQMLKGPAGATGLVMRRESIPAGMKLPSPDDVHRWASRRLTADPTAILSSSDHMQGLNNSFTGGMSIESTASDSEHPLPMHNSPEHAETHKLEEASKRSGRPRRQRKKTVSDMTGMLKA